MVLTTNKSSLRQPATTCRRQTGSAGAFTLMELLVVIGMTGLLATVLLSASFTTSDRVLRAECASNLKQIGSATLVYAVENNDFVPQVSWHNPPPSGLGNPWQTYEACRMPGVGSRQIMEGAYGLALLFFGKEVADPKIFYCPSVTAPIFAYSTYSEEGWPWPSIPPDYTGANPYVRCSYNYYAQPRMTEDIATANYGDVTLPALNAQSLALVSPYPGDPPQAAHPYPALLKSTDVDPQKSITTDVVTYTAVLSHRASGSVAGANVLFGDGHVKWVPVRGNNKVGSRLPFDPRLWDPFAGSGTGPGNDPDAFRIIMNGWMP